MEEVTDHNAAKWLSIAYRDTRLENAAGWVVIRTCPCHDGERVTVHYHTRSQADHAKETMLAISGSR